MSNTSWKPDFGGSATWRERLRGDRRAEQTERSPDGQPFPRDSVVDGSSGMLSTRLVE
jgi:hypothetical protein